MLFPRLSFHLSSGSQHVSPFFDFTFLLPHGSVIAGIGLCQVLANLAGGSLGFRIVLCCFSSSQIAVWLFRDFVLPG